MDIKEIPLADRIENKNQKIKVKADGGYASCDIFALCQKHRIYVHIHIQFQHPSQAEPTDREQTPYWSSSEAESRIQASLQG